MNEISARHASHDRLPPEAAAKLQRLKDRAEEALAFRRMAAQRAKEAREDFRRARDWLAELQTAHDDGRLTKRTRATPAYWDEAAVAAEHARQQGEVERSGQSLSGERIEADKERLARERERVAQLAAAHGRRETELAEAGERAEKLAGLVRAVEDWLRTLPEGAAIKPHDGALPKPKKGEAGVDAVERLRQRIDALGTELDTVRHAPLPAAEVKRRARAQIEALAERGRPKVSNSASDGGWIEWPKAPVQVGVVVVGAQGVTIGDAPDPMALIAWVHRDALVAGVEALVDAAADPAALDEKARRDRIAALASEILGVERGEEAAIEAIEAAGLQFVRRPEADPRAVLNLAGELLAPRER